VVEALGTGFLLVSIVGSGILGERLAGGNIALTLLVNALSTAAALFAIIQWLAPLSGAHLKPLIILAAWFRGDMSRRAAVAYVVAQVAGAVVGVALGNLMFGAPVLSMSTHDRSGLPQLLGEFVSTFGLMGIVLTSSNRPAASTAGVVATFIGAAFWFTPTDFANPAVTVARALTDSFSGIQPLDVPGFIAAEFAGVAAAVALFRWLLTPTATSMKHP
jgi:glycerol uptake facilitator-like aquaporin